MCLPEAAFGRSLPSPVPDNVLVPFCLILFGIWDPDICLRSADFFGRSVPSQVPSPLLPHPLWYLRSGHLPEIRGLFPEAAFGRSVPSQVPDNVLVPFCLILFGIWDPDICLRSADFFLRQHFGDSYRPSPALKPKSLTMYLSLLPSPLWYLRFTMTIIKLSRVISTF